LNEFITTSRNTLNTISFPTRDENEGLGLREGAKTLREGSEKEIFATSTIQN
jgi:hypothetical protein